jgi:hypothetical protein
MLGIDVDDSDVVVRSARQSDIVVGTPTPPIGDELLVIGCILESMGGRWLFAAGPDGEDGEPFRPI